MNDSTNLDEWSSNDNQQQSGHQDQQQSQQPWGEQRATGYRGRGGRRGNTNGYNGRGRGGNVGYQQNGRGGGGQGNLLSINNIINNIIFPLKSLAISN